MKEKFIIFGVFVLMAAILVALNAASYTQRQKDAETELFPNRTSFNAGPTGTQAFYTLLSETGRRVVRWQEPADVIETVRKDPPATFVVIGPFRRDFKEQEYTGLLRWVAAGGRLVVIDREPPEDLVKTTGNWKIEITPKNLFGVVKADPSDQKQMIGNMPAAKPGQPSLFSYGVNAVQASQFASTITIERLLTTGGDKPVTSMAPPPRSSKLLSDPQNKTRAEPVSQSKPDVQTEPPPSVDIKRNGKIYTITTPTPTPVPMDRFKLDTAYDEADNVPDMRAPVVHFASDSKNLLVDVPFGSGEIVYLSDPYIVSNGGISLVDNSQLAINIVSRGNGVIAFDEYHQGFGGNRNRLFEFFAGTPVVSIFFQCVCLIGLVFYSRSRRFGRALPENEPDRLSKLEYVNAMAEMQRRTKAYDLAIENIYRDFRRRAARLVGVDNVTTGRNEFAARIAERAKTDRAAVEHLMFKCEDIIIGEPTNRAEILDLVKKIRALEQALGMRNRVAS